MKLIIEMLVPHIILFKLCNARSTPCEMLESGKFPKGAAALPGKKALMELLFEELICAPERLGFQYPKRN